MLEAVGTSRRIHNSVLLAIIDKLRCPSPFPHCLVLMSLSSDLPAEDL